MAEKKSRKGLLLVGIAGAGALLYFLTKKTEASETPVVGIGWDGVAAGPVTFELDSVHRLSISVQSLSAAPHIYNIEWKCGGTTAAKWTGVNIPAGQTVTLTRDIIFGIYQPGDCNFDGKIGVADILTVENMMLQNTVENDAADVDGDGRIGVGDILLIENIMLQTSPIPAMRAGAVSSVGMYASTIVVTETTLDKTLSFDFDSITITEPVVITGFADFSSTPSGANVSISSGDSGTTPFVVELPAGDYSFTATASGYGNYTGSFSIVAGQTTAVSFTMTPSVPTYGYLSSSVSPSGATIKLYKNGTLYTSVMSGSMTTVDNGVYNYEIVLSGYESVTGTVTISGGQTSSIGPITLVPSALVGVTLNWG